MLAKQILSVRVIHAEKMAPNRGGVERLPPWKRPLPTKVTAVEESYSQNV